MKIEKLQYIFDPLCGWCYASAPALAYLAQSCPQVLELLPSGLFSGEGARPMSPQFAAYAWGNDQRIASLTGQRFSEEYHQLLNSGGNFDSHALNCALTACERIAPEAEAGLLHELQIARYVRGLDTSRSDVVAKISNEYAMAKELEIHFPTHGDPFTAGTELAEITDKRTDSVKQLMRSVGVSGVPLLLVTIAGKTSTVSGADLYGGPASVSHALKKLL
ncbi:protein-disulfide isomerase [uncultured Cedecea sp.]|uniref:DsbA family protein n=1 Tax=uncultured Cedecea sp. TaxID=988762 RepID=UPI002617893E|nr:protein-disulfide isomerase [uncultured Cedecea sp.]